MIGWMTVADILRITTPLISRNAAQLQQKQPGPPGENFSIDDTMRVLKANPQTEMLMQNNAMVDKDSSVPVYVDLLTDPDVMNGYMSSVLLLQEIIGLLPLNSRTVTPEIREMYDALFVLPEDIVPELIRQERASTAYNGKLYNFIRSVLEQDKRPETLYPALRLIKYFDEANSNRKLMKSVVNYLKHLSESLFPSKELSARLNQLSDSIRDAASDKNALFSIFNNSIIPLLNDVKGSVLNSEATERLLSLIVYNLSRYSNNPDALPQLGEQFAEQLEGNSLKLEFIALLKSAIAGSQIKASSNGSTRGDFTDSIIEKSDATVGFSEQLTDSEILFDSKVMEALTKLIGAKSEFEGLSDKAKDRLNNIVNGLLSSPSNFTPLLHYILPLEYENVRAYAEIWINPNSAEEDELAGESLPEPSTHFLIVFGVDGIGMFEAEFFVRGRTIDFLLLCPEEHLDLFTNLKPAFRDSIRSSKYRFGDVRFDRLKNKRSIVEVFTSLPYRRMGIDFTI